jgi:3-oxoacyl-[acyl-carrier-protein] synthase-1
MSRTYLSSGSVISSLGWEPGAHLDALRQGRGGILPCEDKALSPTPLPLARVDTPELERRVSEWSCGIELTRFEKLALLSMKQALAPLDLDTSREDVLLVLSTTKGNVELLENHLSAGPGNLSLWISAHKLASCLDMRTRPMVVSNACISGVVAMLMAHRQIREGRYKHVIAVGADVLSSFIISGFQSFHSLSGRPCRPYDADRDGLSLGEAAATAVFSADPGTGAADIVLERGAISNDANHISGPSRTGEGLYRAIGHTLKGEQVDLISAHGTATLYNDEMEAIALERAGLLQVPVNSLKGSLGHTLGAAGLLESLLNIEAMRHNLVLPTPGYQKHGVSRPMQVSTQPAEASLQTLLKVASGFGGCNAAVLFRKVG